MRQTSQSVAFQNLPTVNRRQWLQFAASAGVGGLLAGGASRSLAAERADVDWLDEIQQRPSRIPDDAIRLEPLKGAGSAEDWPSIRQAIRQRWLDFLSPWWEEVPTPSYEIVEEDRVGEVARKRIRYEAEPEVWNEAYLLEPRAPRTPQRNQAGVVAMHSTVSHSIRQPAGVEGKPEKAFGLKLAQQGCVAICPRNFLWPDNHHISAQSETQRFHERRPQSKGMAKMLYDAVQAVNLLVDHPQVDPKRIGCVGHSLGAKEVLYLAAFDERITAAVSSEGGIGTTFSNWDAPWYLGPEIKNFPHEHHEVLALVAPRPFLLVGGDSADGARSWPFIEAVLPIWKQSAAARAAAARVGLLNHGKGHAVPAEAERRIHDWLQTYLQI